MSRIHANNFSTTLNGSITNVATSIVLTSVANFPAIGAGVECHVTITDGTNIEIVKATSRSSFTLTVTRGAEGTTGTAFASGSTVEIRPTADSVDRKLDISDTTTNLVTATTKGTTKLIAGGNSTAAGYIELLEDTDNGSNKLTITGQQSMASDKTVTFQDVTGTVYVSGGTDVPVTDGGTGLSATTAYAVLCGGTTSTGALQSVASVGTAGQILTSNGAGALPTFQTATSAAGLTLISVSTASASSSIVFSSGLDSTYTNYLFLLQGLYFSASTTMRMYYSVDGGSSYYTGGTSVCITSIVNSAATQNITVNPVADYIDLSAAINGVSGSSSLGFGGRVELNNIAQAGTVGTTLLGTIIAPATGGYTNFVQANAQLYAGGTAINAIKFQPVSGTITGGTISLYGYKKS